MTSPRWWSQPFPATGAIASEGIRNQLGRPPVDPLTVFVRETAQNSWDARLPGSETRYRLEFTTVAPVHRPTWERLLTPPAAVQDHLTVGRAVRSPGLPLLLVVDRGTKGLGGPTRADEAPEGVRDWISFVLNVGEKRDTTQGGGTYGYGKAVLYRLSKVGTILVHTRTADPGTGLVTRLIGIALGDSYEDRGRVDSTGRPYTGRHWWGDVREDHVEPLVGETADEMARALGLPAFAPDESGTTLVVIDPDLGELEGAEDAAAHLAQTIAWQLWPILLPERGSNRLVTEVVAGGRTYPVPDPSTTYPLRLFVAAHRALRTDRSNTLECRSPRRRLGRLSLERAVVLPMSPDSVTAAAAYAGVDGDPHHVCLMRSPELVVRYHEGPQTNSVHQAYAGVFRADDTLDEVYAAAEPPTHDNWVHEQLTGEARTFVRVTFTRLREQLSMFRVPAIAAAHTTSGVALGAAANYLGGLVAAAFAQPEDPTGSRDPAEHGDRTSGSRRGPAPFPNGKQTTAPERVHAKPLDDPHVEEHDGSVVLVARYMITGNGPVRLVPRLSVATWDGREDAPPVDAATPQIVEWRTAERAMVTEEIVVDAPTEIALVVAPVADTATDITVVVRPAGEGGPS